jgi:hypothetical protein
MPLTYAAGEPHRLLGAGPAWTKRRKSGAGRRIMMIARMAVREGNVPK